MIDSPPLFAAALDPQDGGLFTLEQAVPGEPALLPGTNVLETTFSTGDGTVRVTDSLNQSPQPGRDDLAALVFQALYQGIDLHTFGGAYIAVPRRSMLRWAQPG